MRFTYGDGCFLFTGQGACQTHSAPGHRPGHPRPRRPAELHRGARTPVPGRPPHFRGAVRARQGEGGASLATDPQPGRCPAACRPPAGTAAPRPQLRLGPPGAPAWLPAAPPRALRSAPCAGVWGPTRRAAPLWTPGRELRGFGIGQRARRLGGQVGRESQPRRVLRAPGFPSSPGLGGARRGQGRGGGVGGAEGRAAPPRAPLLEEPAHLLPPLTPLLNKWAQLARGG